MKIGGVTIKEDFYSGTDLYSDGDIEDELLEIAKDYPEEDLNQVIKNRKSWPILYHFSDIRKNIISWLPIQKSDNILEVGSGCGAVTGGLAEKAGKVTCIELSKKRSMINAYRNQNFDNIEILLGNFQDIEPELQMKYNYITLIGVLEYAALYIRDENPFEEMLRRIERHLTSNGKIIIAIENRLGLKYWAGCAEDHNGLYFEGLEGYTQTDGAKTFSKKELKNIIDSAGQFDVSFYYPYPDYKFPMQIYSDDYLPRRGELANNICNMDRKRLCLFDETKVYDTLLESGMFAEFSNSFLVVLEKKQEM